MKLNNLNEQYLTGLVDMAISNYIENCNGLPEHTNLTYSFEFGIRANFNDIKADKEIVKITFKWLGNPEFVMIDDDTNSTELRGEKCDDHFTVILGERLFKLQLYVEEILDRITT